MRTFSFSAKHWSRQSIAKTVSNIFKLSFLVVILISCTKEDIPVEEENIGSTNNNSIIAEANNPFMYSGLDAQTVWELKQARAATAKYLKLENAKKDGYSDINVVVENMGYHFAKMDYVLDGEFDPRKPEILVYNKDMAGNYYLVAVEYAVPLNLPQPAGFTGNIDEWDPNTGFGLWLLHAWVWAYNPLGVFKPTNPNVHLH